MILTVPFATTYLSVEVPTREEIDAIQAGMEATDCFGHQRLVTRVFARGVTAHGRAYCCYYTRHTETSEMSMSIREGEIVRTLHLTRLLSSHQIDQLQRQVDALQMVAVGGH